MSTRAVLGVLVGGSEPLGNQLGDALAVPLARVPVDAIHDGPVSLDGRIGSTCAWIHLVPSLLADPAADPHAEAALLLRSARAAASTADATGAALTFVAVLPSPGSFRGSAALACDLATTALTSLMRTDIGSWSAPGRRIAGVVHGGLRTLEPPGQRPLEEIRLRTPMGALGTIAHVADAVRFLASTRASYVTGTTLIVDGGCAAYSWVYPTRTI